MADIPISYFKAVVRSQKFNPVNPPSTEDPLPVLNPPGSGTGTLFKLLGDVTDKDFIGKNGFIPVVNGEEVLTLEPLPQVQENGLISGGIVQWTGIGYIFNVSGAFYRIGGVYYESPPVQLTLATPDVTNGRIDVFAVSTGSVALAITGTPSGSPVKPQIDPQTQLELTSVIVGASTTTPTLTTEVIYDQNIEWTGSSSGTGTVAFNSAVNPYQGTLSIEATNIENGLKVRLTKGSDYDLSTVQTLGLQIDLKAAMFAGQNIGVTFLNSAGSAISTELILNMDKALTTYQFIGIALSQFAFTSFLARSIEFRYIKTKGATVHSGFYLDIIKLEGGINPPQTVGYHNQLQGLQGGNATERYHLTNAELLKLQGFSPYSLAQVGATDGQALTWVAANSRFEPVTPSGGGGITGSGTTNEIAYFTGASAIASLPVATYPSLLELSYVKGLTSALQPQINGKQATIAGTLTDTYVATIVAGVPTWTAPSAGSSKWTDVGSDIYRNSAVAIGRATIPTNNTFSVQSKNTGNGNEFFQLLTNAGTLAFSVSQNSALTGVVTMVYNYLLRVGNPTTNLAAVGATFKGGASSSGSEIFKVINLADTTCFQVQGTGIVRTGSDINVGNPTTNLANFGSTFKGRVANDLNQVFRVLNSSDTILFEIAGLGQITYRDGGNHVFGTTTGSKLGTATTQKIAFWNKTPIIQPTNAITASAFVANTSGTLNDTATFGGYTIGQIAAALINTGILA